MRIYSNADFLNLSQRINADPAQLELLEAYKRSREHLTEALEANAPHRELSALRSARSAARFALTRAIDPDQDARRTREQVANLEARRKLVERSIPKLEGHKRVIAELDLKQIDGLLEGQRWLLNLFAQRQG